MNKFVTSLIVGIILLLVSFGTGVWFHASRDVAPMLESKTILVALQNEGVFITESIILDESITLDSSSGNRFKDFFFRDTVTARADIRVAMGIETEQIAVKDIRIENNTITLSIPAPQIFSTELVGDIDVDSERGVVTAITKGSEDYNELISLLKEQARDAVADPDIEAVLNSGAVRAISRFVSSLAPGYQVDVSIK